MTIESFDSAEKQVPRLVPYGHVIKSQVLTTTAAFCSHVITMCALHSWFTTSRVNEKLAAKVQMVITTVVSQ